MPYKEKICGIYTITTPNGSVYVGSSHNIKLRWSEHRSRLRHNKHHSERLQAAWNKHGDALVYEIVCRCASEELEAKEQYYIDKLKAKLNTTPYVGNVWCNEETRQKLAKVHQSTEWKLLRSEIAKRAAIKRQVPVDCSDGRTFVSMKLAADAFGINTSGIKHLIGTQRAGRLGVRFKRSSEPWREVITSHQQAYLTMIANGTLTRPKKINLCKIEGCSKKVKGYGLCDKHFQRFKKRGSPNIVMDNKTKKLVYAE